MNSFIKKYFVALFVITIVSCTDDDDTVFTPDTMTIVDYVSDNPEYSSLLAALQKTGLDVALNGTTTYTIFAPNNAAFAEFLDGTSLDDIPTEVLTQLLWNHVLESVEYTSDVSTGYLKTLATETSSGANVSMYIDSADSIVINGVSTVITTDIETDNGVIHEVDKVIELPTMHTFVTLDSSLSSLAIIATTTPGFTTDFGAILSAEDSNVTFLAPDNEAFVDLGDISELPIAELEQMLLNHVIADVSVSSTFTTGYGNTLATFDDTTTHLSIYIDTDGGVSFNGMSDVTEADIVASNGVIHKTNAVILLPTIITFATVDTTFSSLVTALTRDDQLDQDYIGTLSTPNGAGSAPFTVFAPTDTAFESLLTELEVAALIDIPEDTLTAALNLHVVVEDHMTTSDLETGIVSTLGGDVMVDATAATLTDVNDRVSTITITDIQAANGVIHAIDTVILPQL